MTTQTLSTDYIDMLDQAAQGYLARHQAEHLAEDGSLFDRTVAYLMSSYRASHVQAVNVVGRACVNAAKPAQQPALVGLMLQEAISFIRRPGRQPSASVLCSLTANHLVAVFHIPFDRAQDIASLAFGRANPSTLYVDISRSDCQTVMLRDPERGMCYAVPVAHIVHHVIQNPSRQCLTAVI